MTRSGDTPPAWDERTQLTAFLDYARDTARARCDGISAKNVRKALLLGSPLMTMSGRINHLRWVEYYWFQIVFHDDLLTVGGLIRGPDQVRDGFVQLPRRV